MFVVCFSCECGAGSCTEWYEGLILSQRNEKFKTSPISAKCWLWLYLTISPQLVYVYNSLIVWSPCAHIVCTGVGGHQLNDVDLKRTQGGLSSEEGGKRPSPLDNKSPRRTLTIRKISSIEGLTEDEQEKIATILVSLVEARRYLTSPCGGGWWWYLKAPVKGKRKRKEKGGRERGGGREFCGFFFFFVQDNTKRLLSERPVISNPDMFQFAHVKRVHFLLLKWRERKRKLGRKGVW